MSEENKRMWEIWVDYCRKVNIWYAASDKDVIEKPELEPFGMNPPTGEIVDATLWAETIIKRCEDAEGIGMAILRMPDAEQLLGHATEISRAVRNYILQDNKHAHPSGEGGK